MNLVGIKNKGDIRTNTRHSYLSLKLANGDALSATSVEVLPQMLHVQMARCLSNSMEPYWCLQKLEILYQLLVCREVDVDFDIWLSHLCPLWLRMIWLKDQLLFL